MVIQKKLRGFFKMLNLIFSKKDTHSSLLGKQKYINSAPNKGSMPAKCSVLGMVKYNENSGVEKYGIQDTRNKR